METSEEPIFPGFEEALRSCRPGYPASRLPWPGSAEARRMTVGSGRQHSLLLNQSDPLGRFSKILLGSSHWTSSEEFCYVWQHLDTKFECSAFQLMPLEQSTDDNGSSLLPTLRANDGMDCPSEQRRHTPCLESAAKLWPTPASADAERGSLSYQGNHNPTLLGAAKLWPTPTVPNGGRRNPEGTSITGKKPDGGKAQIDLREYAIRLWPTPIVQCGKNDASPSQYNRNSDPLDVVAAKMMGWDFGSLNPRFVEELMGFEIDHTACAPLATPSCRSRPTRFSRRSRRLKSDDDASEAAVSAQAAGLPGALDSADAAGRLYAAIFGADIWDKRRDVAGNIGVLDL